MRTCLWSILCGFSLMLAGCFATPRVESDPEVFTPGDIERSVYASYWTRYDVPFQRGHVTRRVAITEFSVEFVTVKQVKGWPGGAVKVDVLQYTPIGAGVNLLGIGRRNAEFDEDLLAELPGELYKLFVETLQERGGVRVLPPAFVAGSDAYQRYETKGEDESSFVSYLNPFGSDTGRIRETVTHPMKGLRIITGARGDEDVEDVDAALMEEVGADFVARCRFRVGVHNGAASVERGSIVTVTGRDVLGYLESSRSLASEQAVLKNDGFLPIKGHTYDVHSGKYKLAMRTLFPLYVDLAVRGR